MQALSTIIEFGQLLSSPPPHLLSTGNEDGSAVANAIDPADIDDICVTTYNWGVWLFFKYFIALKLIQIMHHSARLGNFDGAGPARTGGTIYFESSSITRLLYIHHVKISRNYPGYSCPIRSLSMLIKRT